MLKDAQMIEAKTSVADQREQLKDILNQTLDLAKAKGATAAEMSTSLHQGFSVTVRNQSVETVEFSRDKGIGITVYFGQKKGSASSSDTDIESIKKTVEAACQIAEYTEEDPHAGLARAELMAKDIKDLDLYHPWQLSNDDAIEMASKIEAAGLDFDPKISNSEGASVSTHESLVMYGNSHGFVGCYPTSRHNLSCCLIAKQDEKMQRDYDYSVSRRAEELMSPEQIGQMAAERTVARLGAKKIKTQQCPILFSPQTARSLWRHFFSAISGGAVYRKSSFLVDYLEKSVFPEHIQIHEDPFIPRALASSAFDAEGVATQARNWIVDGVLQSYMMSSYSARQLNMETTGNAGGIHNVFIKDSGKSLKEMLSTMGTGIFVNELIGHGVNIVTGDYSRGCAGFWVENGEIQYPVEEITIAGNLKDMFMNITDVGADTDKRGAIQTGSVLVSEMALAGE